jgi:transposase InsO family protein
MHKSRTSWPLETRVKLVVTYQELHKQHPRLSICEFCRYHQVPYATFARWVAAWRRRGRLALADRPRRPKRHPTALSGAEVTIIRRAHAALGWGVHRLYAHLRQLHLIRCSLSSLYRVLRRCGALIRRPRKPKPVWIRYAKAFPGERAQMDLMYLPQGRYQLTLIDDCTRLTGATVLASRTMQTVLAVLPHLLDAFPFRLRCIQTDNGPEFGQEVSRWLSARGVRHTRIRPRCPHLNGKVERVQRTIEEEYWDGLTAPPGPAWERGLQRYLRSYNRQRLHSALDYRTPWQYYQLRLAAGAQSLT